MVELAVFLFDLLVLHYLPVDHLLNLLIEFVVDELVQLYKGLIVDFFLLLDEFRKRLLF